jgi:hypothetical protein
MKAGQGGAADPCGARFGDGPIRRFGVVPNRTAKAQADTAFVHVRTEIALHKACVKWSTGHTTDKSGRRTKRRSGERKYEPGGLGNLSMHSNRFLGRRATRMARRSKRLASAAARSSRRFTRRSLRASSRLREAAALASLFSGNTTQKAGFNSHSLAQGGHTAARMSCADLLHVPAAVFATDFLPAFFAPCDRQTKQISLNALHGETHEAGHTSSAARSTRVANRRNMSLTTPHESAGGGHQ